MTWKNDKDRRDSCVEFESQILTDIMYQLKTRYNFNWHYEIENTPPQWCAHLSILMDKIPQLTSLWVGLSFDWQDSTKIVDSKNRMLVADLADPNYIDKIYNHFIKLKEQNDTRRH